jgi:hypothetical protein
LVHDEDGGRKSATVDAVLAVANDLGVQPAQVAVAWLVERARRSPTGVVPVIGPRSVEQLDDYLAALTLEIDTQTYARLDQVSHIDLGEPYNKLAENDAPRGGGDPVPSGTAELSDQTGMNSTSDSTTASSRPGAVTTPT